MDREWITTFIQAAYQSVGPKDYPTTPLPPPIHPEVEVKAVSPVSPSILKLKDEAVESETILQCSKEKK